MADSKELAGERRGTPLPWRSVDGYEDLRAGPVYITVESRPAYCDRGRWIVKASSNSPMLVIDYADAFPRYYFDRECLEIEMTAWLSARGLSVEHPSLGVVGGITNG